MTGQAVMSIWRWSTLRIFMWGGMALLLLTPLVAMQFTSDVTWTAFDFAPMGPLLVGFGLVLELAVKLSANPAYRTGAGLAMMAAIGLFIVNGAVGFLGDEHNPANL